MKLKDRIKLLAVGDLHLGRSPTRTPQDSGVELCKLNSGAAWKRVIDEAIRQRVDLVLLAGDVVESENDYFEAHRYLSEGVQKLKESGIQIVGVTGNHDFSVLPKIAKRIDHLKLLGSNGDWERMEVDGIITLHGLSFVDRHVKKKPLEGIHFKRGPGVNIGLLHCDRDQTGSVYAPVSSRELSHSQIDHWLLGHIHKPDPLSIKKGGYLGCVTSMDVDETGDLGPWVYVIERDQIISVTQSVLAPFRIENIGLDLSPLLDLEEIREGLFDKVSSLMQELQHKTAAPEVVGLVLNLVGSTDLGTKAQKMFQKDQGKVFETKYGVEYFIVDCVDNTQPEISLELLSQRDDPPGLLARRLLSLGLSNGREETDFFLAKAREQLDKVIEKERWNDVSWEQELFEEKELSREKMVKLFEQAGLMLLKKMLK